MIRCCHRTGFLVLLTAIAFLTACSSEKVIHDKPTPEQIQAFQAVKSIKVKVDASYGSGIKSKPAFEEVAAAVINDMGLEAVGSLAPGGDATLKVKAKGKSGGVGRSLISGKLSLSAGNQNLVRTFTGFSDKPHLGKYYGKIGATYYDDEVIFEKDSFVPELIEALADLCGNDRIYKLLADPNKNLRLVAALVLGERKDSDSVQWLMALFHDSEPMVKDAAVTALAKIGEPAVEHLRKALDDSDMIVRRKASMALMQMGDAASADTWINALRDEDPAIKKAASEALARVGEPVVTLLISGLKDKDKYFRRDVAAVLGLIKDPRAIDPLIAQWKDVDFNLAKDCATAIAAYGDEARPKVEAAVKDKNAAMRKNGVYVLGLWKNPADLDLIAPLVDDKDPEVQMAMVAALKEFNDEKAKGMLKKMSTSKFPLVADLAGEAMNPTPPPAQ